MGCFFFGLCVFVYLRDREIVCLFFSGKPECFRGIVLGKAQDESWHRFCSYLRTMATFPPKSQVLAASKAEKPRYYKAKGLHSLEHLEGREGQAEVQPWPWLLSSTAHKAWPRDDEWAVLSFTGCKTTSTRSTIPYTFGEAETPSNYTGKSKSSWGRTGGFGFYEKNHQIYILLFLT